MIHSDMLYSQGMPRLSAPSRASPNPGDVMDCLEVLDPKPELVEAPQYNTQPVAYNTMPGTYGTDSTGETSAVGPWGPGNILTPV